MVSLLKDLGYEMEPVLAIDAKVTEHILHKQGVEILTHVDVAYLWMQDEIRSKRLRVRRVKSEENVADLGTKPFSKAVIAKHCFTLGYVNMAEENGQCKVQGVAMIADFDSVQMFVTGVRTSSTQNMAGDHVKMNSRAVRNSSSGSGSRRRSRKMGLEAIYTLYLVKEYKGSRREELSSMTKEKLYCGDEDGKKKLADAECESACPLHYCKVHTSLPTLVTDAPAHSHWLRWERGRRTEKKGDMREKAR